MKRDTETKLSTLSIAMHWSVAVGMIGLLASGIYMAETKLYAIYPWHKAIGFLLLFLAVGRAVWRLSNGLPTPPQSTSKITHNAASAMHWLLLVSTILMPLSGMAMSILGGHGLDVFGFEVAAHIENPSEQFMAWATTGKKIHVYLGYALVALISIHAVAAIKHHVVDKDLILKRMIGRS